MNFNGILKTKTIFPLLIFVKTKQKNFIAIHSCLNKKKRNFVVKVLILLIQQKSMLILNNSCFAVPKVQ